MITALEQNCSMPFKNMIKQILIFTLSFSFLLSLHSKNEIPFDLFKVNLVQIDSFPFNVKQDYKGYRLHISKFEVVKQKGAWVKIKLNLTNTGREIAKLGKDRTSPSLLFRFDKSINESNFNSYKEAIILNLRRTEMTLNPGQLVMGHELKLLYKAETPIIEEPMETEVETPIVETVIEKKSRKKKKKEEDISVTINDSTLSSEITKKPAKKKRQKKKSKKEEAKREIVVKEETIPIIEESMVDIHPSSSSIESTETAVLPPTTTAASTPSEVFIEENLGNSNSEDLPIEADPSIKAISIIEANAGCPDLVIDTITLVKQTKNWITIEYTITNYGGAPATMIGTKRGERDNLGIKAFLSRTQRVNKGAIIMGGGFIPDNFNGGSPDLASGESYTGKIKLDYKKRTRFTPYLILDLDVFEFVPECNEKNNKNSYLTE